MINFHVCSLLSNHFFYSRSFGACWFSECEFGPCIISIGLGVLQVMASHFKIIQPLRRWDAIQYRRDATTLANKKVVTALFLFVFQFLMRENVFAMLTGPGTRHPHGHSKWCGGYCAEKKKKTTECLCPRTVTAISNSICIKVKFRAIIRLLGRCDCEPAV